MMVVTSSAKTTNVAMAQRITHMTWVIVLLTTVAYLMVAIAAPVIGNVYAHQDNENLFKKKEKKVRDY